LANIWRVKSGKPAAMTDRSMMLAATAEAALSIIVVSFLPFLVVYFRTCKEDLHREICIDQVIETWHEDGKHSGASEDTSGCRSHPVDRRIPCCPCEPRD
jgi:hypothetical protein